MPPSKIRFVTLCQQLLALAVVLAVLTPAASVISLDVAHEGPDATGADVPVSDISAALRAYTRHEQPVFMPEDERRIAQAGQAE